MRATLITTVICSITTFTLAVEGVHPLHDAAPQPSQAVAPSPCGYGCGACLPAENATTPNVLLVGDSISMGSYGYAWYVRELLAANNSGLATVQHAGGFGGGGQFASVASHVSCFSGAKSTYLKGHHFDVATINVGIHGCCNSSERVTDANYVADLRLVLMGLAAHATHVKFVTTTPVSYAVSQPPSSILAGCIEHRNVLAKQVVAELAGARNNVSGAILPLLLPPARRRRCADADRRSSLARQSATCTTLSPGRTDSARSTTPPQPPASAAVRFSARRAVTSSQSGRSLEGRCSPR